MSAYRNEREALHARVLELEERLGETRIRAERAERQLDALASGCRAPLRSDLHHSLVKGILWAQAAVWGAFVVVSVPAYIALAYDSPPVAFSPMLAGIMTAAVVNLCFAPFGVLSVLGAIGLTREKRYGWVCAVLAFALSCLSLVYAPVGGYALGMLLRRKVREAFFPSGSRPAVEHRPPQRFAGVPVVQPLAAPATAAAAIQPT